jgi:glycine/D-amino acid oxidase-like deaminating enzyme
MTARGAPQTYGSSSYWMSSLNEDLTMRAPATGKLTVDVAILGGGFSGLWTAYYLLRDNPGLEVAIVEREICGFGASGRNGGWVSGRVPMDLSALVARLGPERARKVAIAIYETVEEIARVAQEESIEAHFRCASVLSIARTKAQIDSIQATHRAHANLGLGEYNKLLSVQETCERVRLSRNFGSLLTTRSGSLHPGRLVRGLARAVERKGGAIYEGSSVVKISTGRRPTLHLANGAAVIARKSLVLGAEAYLSQQSRYHRNILPVTSMIVLTAPLTEAQWKPIGWENGESLCSQALTKDYLTRTADGRILYGSRGATYRFGSRISDESLRDESIFSEKRRDLLDWFPTLSSVEFTHQWGGFLGIPRDGLPIAHFDSTAKVAALYGFAGRGVALTNLSARLIAGLICNRRTSLEDLPWHRPVAQKWEPEPFRWLGVRYVERALQRIDAADTNGQAAPGDTALVKRLFKL